VERQPQAVIEDIARCEYVASSSLHGVIIAHALGVPAVWLRMSDQLKGGDFKFRDYASALGMQLAAMDLDRDLTTDSIIAAATLPNAAILEARQKVLDELFQGIAQEVRA
jgi:polysaccharide pyruvyl transferase WcaK-like protein